MTAAFIEFMRQYRLTGSEKADGYSRNAFIGLDEHEKETVFGLLESELPFSAEWLVFLDRDRAIEVLKAEEPRWRQNPYAHAYLAQEELVRHCGDLVYQRHMIEDYSNYDVRLKPLLISAVWRTPQNADTIAFFKRVILSEADEDAAKRAVSELLSALEVPRTTEEGRQSYDRLRKQLLSDDPEVKLRALKYLERYE
jgi:hypothetical protein